MTSNYILYNVIKEAGPNCLATSGSFKSLIGNTVKNITELDVSKCLAWMARTSASVGVAFISGTSSLAPDKLALNYQWNVENFVLVVNDLVSNLNWKQIILLLDQNEDFYCSDPNSFNLLIRAFTSATKLDFPFELFLERYWVNGNSQISFLKQATQSGGFEFLKYISAHPDLRILTNEMLQNIPQSTRLVANGWLNSPWNCIDLLKVYVYFASSGNDEAKQYLDLGSRQATELICIGLVKLFVQDKSTFDHGSLRINANSPILEPLKKLIMLFLVGHSSSTFVLSRIWPIEQSLIVKSMTDWYFKEPSGLSRILDVTQELKALTFILDSCSLSESTPDVMFSIDLAALASRREYLNLEKWLLDKLTNLELFRRSFLEFYHFKVFSRSISDSKSIPLHEEIVSLFQKILQQKSSFFLNIPLYKEIVQGFNSKTVNEDFSKDVEERASSYFEKMYLKEISPTDFLSQIIELLNRDETICNCIVFILFDEFKAYGSYPDEQLLLAAELFGLFILEEGRSNLKKVLTPAKLALALRKILESLKKPASSKLFKFGLRALQQFQSRLREWPQYCSHLLQISHLNEVYPDLMKIVGAQVNPESKRETIQPTNSIQDENSSSLVSVSHSSNSEKILFLLNNLSESNVSQKSKEMKALLIGVSNFKWFSNYLVINRIAIEPNNHKLYLKLVYDELIIKDLENVILDETLSNCKVLLKSEKSVTNTQERMLLKNLGAWLGQITLAKNIPLKERDLGLKALLVDGFIQQRLIVVIPFVCKILEQTKDSKVFRLPNPWLVGLLRLLVELYYYAELKLNLKFEVEVLLRNINVEIKHLESARIIRDTIQQMNQQHQITVHQQQQQQVSQPHQKISKYSEIPSITVDEDGNFYINNLVNYISYNHPVINTNPVLKKILLVAMDRTVREIIMPVVERSVSISVVTTRELILKDYSNEPNEERLRLAGVTMAQSLAGNLAMVTCREPFRFSLAQQIRVMSMQALGENGNIELILEQAINDNVELGCLIIQKAAMERSIVEITNELSQNLMQRRKQRERGIDWSDDYANRTRVNMVLPDASLRLRQQQYMNQVYEEFNNMPGIPSKPVGAVSTSKSPNQGSLGGQSILNNNSTSILLSNLSKLLQSMTQVLRTMTQQKVETSLLSLPLDHELVNIIRQINSNINQNASSDVLLWFTESVLRSLYHEGFSSNGQDSVSALEIDAYMVLLERCCEINKIVGRELVLYLIYNVEDIMNANNQSYRALEVTVKFILNGLVNIYEFDSFLSHQLEALRLPLVKFALKLIYRLLVQQDKALLLLTPLEFYYTLTLFNAKQEILQIELSSRASSNSFRSTEIEDMNYYHMLKDLVHLFNGSSIAIPKDMSFIENVEELFKKITDSKNVSETVDQEQIRCLLEFAIDNYYKLKNIPGAAITLAYKDMDLITTYCLANYYKCLASGDMRAFTSFLSIVSLIVIQAHDSRRDLFDARPYFRIFVVILEEIGKLPPNNLSDEYYICLGNCLHVLRPKRLPSFIFAFIQLISHKMFLKKMLQTNTTSNQSPSITEQQLHQSLNLLLIDVFQFLAPFLRHAELTDPIRVLYKGTLRLLLILLHDFPEFLCEFHFSLCDVIPPSCIQLRNLILSAFPRNMRLPDPFTRDLKIDLLPETFKQPVIQSDYMLSILKSEDLFKNLQKFLMTASFPEEGFIKSFILKEEEILHMGTQYNISLINSFVMYLGVHANEQQQQQQQTSSPVQRKDGKLVMELFKTILLEMDSEGRYHFLNAIANQLRYPNSHSHYFSCTILFLFSESGNEVVKEQITRVLLERLIVNRPHPWALLITFIELLKNPRYNFWGHSFTSCAPDIERLFASVARSCMIPVEGIGREGEL